MKYSILIAVEYISILIHLIIQKHKLIIVFNSCYLKFKKVNFLVKKLHYFFEYFFLFLFYVNYNYFG